MENILGISAGFHDAAVAVIADKQVKYASHSERYSKQKHDKNLHIAQFSNGRMSDVNTVAYYEKPLPKYLRMLYAGQTPQWQSARSTVLGKDLYLAQLKHCEFENHSHHLSHAAAGFQTSQFYDAICVVIDAIGEWDTISIWHAEYNLQGYADYEKLWSMRYPNSLGLFYSAITEYLGLRPNDDEYITMGMAAYGTPIIADMLDAMLFDGLQTKHNLHIGLPAWCRSQLDNYSHYDVAASAQAVIERKLHTVFARARKLAKEHCTENLVYMGGVALNCSANTHVLQGWKDVWIMPAPGDAGSAIGAAALSYGRRIRNFHPYLGTVIPGNYPVDNLVHYLLKYKIAGVANGAAEFGPRALGNRSLLADPRGSEIKDAVNEIKRRQKFRPFAPVILEEHAGDYFDMAAIPNASKTSPYMQYVVKCLKPDEFPAIVHADNTSRVQTVGKHCPSGIRQLLEAWYAATGCPMLLNTSLNIRSMPMVNDATDAAAFEKKYNVKVFTNSES